MQDKIIVALDVSPEKAREIVAKTKDLTAIYKMGPVLWHQWGAESLSFFKDQGVRVMIDFKFHDIPSVAAASLVCLAGHQGSEVIWGVTLHALGGFSMLRTAVIERDKLPKDRKFLLFGVTVLTSMREKDLYRVGINRTVDAQVKKLSMLAQDAGLDGVVASAKEISAIRKVCGKDQLVLVPGISLDSNRRRDLDQKRAATPREAFELGADHLIIGRDIYQAEDPRERLEMMIEAIRVDKILH